MADNLGEAAAAAVVVERAATPMRLRAFLRVEMNLEKQLWVICWRIYKMADLILSFGIFNSIERVKVLNYLGFYFSFFLHIYVFLLFFSFFFFLFLFHFLLKKLTHNTPHHTHKHK